MGGKRGEMGGKGRMCGEAIGKWCIFRDTDESLAHSERDVGHVLCLFAGAKWGVHRLGPPGLQHGPHGLMALLVRYREEAADGWYCPPKMAQDVLTPDELDMVVGYAVASRFPIENAKQSHFAPFLAPGSRRAPGSCF